MKYATAARVVFALLAGAVSCFAQDSPVVAPTPVADAHERLHKYVWWSTLGPESAIRATLASGFQQLQDAPREWGTGATGYAKRWASEYAESAVGNTTKDVVARILHHDTSHTRCECTGFGPRFRHAISSPFMARKPDGTRVLSPATVAGLFAGHVVPASTWYPAPLGARGGLKHAASDIVGTIGTNLFREFWPRRAK